MCDLIFSLSFVLDQCFPDFFHRGTCKINFRVSTNPMKALGGEEKACSWECSLVILKLLSRKFICRELLFVCKLVLREKRETFFVAFLYSLFLIIQISDHEDYSSTADCRTKVPSIFRRIFGFFLRHLNIFIFYFIILRGTPGYTPTLVWKPCARRLGMVSGLKIVVFCVVR
jgi:hypothetical protein